MQWHAPQVNKHQVWQGYVDSYDSHAFGILQENCQNSFDAYSEGANPADAKVIIRYDVDTRVLSHRDFRTLGMPHCRYCEWGIVDGGKECTDTGCPWGCFHNMGYSGKAGEALGSRGMGKALQLLAGSKTVVRTTLPDGRFHASVWEREDGNKDWHWRAAPEEARKFSEPGTELVTSGVIDKVHSQLLDVPMVLAELQERWFRMIEAGATIEYLLVKGGKVERHFARGLTNPPLDTSEGREKAERLDPEVVITYQGSRLGVLRNLHLFMAKSPFPEGDSRWGIAIVKNGKQTVQRFRDFPEEMPESVRKRIFGYCDAICTQSEPFLKDAENAQHTGYQYSHPTYKAVRRNLREIAKQFGSPFLRSGGERVTEAEQMEAREILDVLNKALADVTEFGVFGKDGVSLRRKVTTTPKTRVYLSRLEFENKTYKRGEKLTVSAVVKNPTASEVLVRTVFQHFDPTPVVVQLTQESVLLRSGTSDTPETAATSFQVYFDPSQATGIHWVQVALQDLHGDPLLDEEGQPIVARRGIYCEFEPRKIQRSRSGTGSLSPGQGTGGGEGSFGLSGLMWFKKADAKDTLEGYIDQSQAVAFINLKGRRFEFAKEGSKSKKACWPIVGEIVAEELVKVKAQLDAEEREQWTAEEVKNKIIELENLKGRLVRRMTELLTS